MQKIEKNEIWKREGEKKEERKTKKGRERQSKREIK